MPAASRGPAQLSGCPRDLVQGIPMPHSDHVHVFAILTAQPGKESILRDALLAMIEPTKKEPGCISYMLHEDPKNPSAFYFFEIYKDQAATDFHMNSPYLAATVEKVGPILATPPVIVLTKLIGGA
jgi:quinol monooxygenase YgiN